MVLYTSNVPCAYTSLFIKLLRVTSMYFSIQRSQLWGSTCIKIIPFFKGSPYNPVVMSKFFSKSSTILLPCKTFASQEFPYMYENPPRLCSVLKRNIIAHCCTLWFFCNGTLYCYWRTAGSAPLFRSIVWKRQTFSWCILKITFVQCPF